MSASREKYRNPPPPVVDVQKEEPRLDLKKAAYEDSPIYILMKKLLDAAAENQQKEAHREATMAKIPFQNQVALNEPIATKIPVQSQLEEISKYSASVTWQAKEVQPGRSLKDTFWRDIDEGKINIPDQDMYSKVKERASRTLIVSDNSKSPESRQTENPLPPLCPKVVLKRKPRSRSDESLAYKSTLKKPTSLHVKKRIKYDILQDYRRRKSRVHRKRNVNENRQSKSAYRTSDKSDDSTSENGYKILQDLLINEILGSIHMNLSGSKMSSENVSSSVPKRESHKKSKDYYCEDKSDTKKYHPLMRRITLHDKSKPLRSKYPEPAVGYHRKKLDTPSVIQNFLDNNSKFPCPGLHKVTEIRSPTETVYYCAICDCNCGYSSITQHLGGFRHQLNYVKYYRSDLFEKWSYKPKYQIHDKLLEILYKEEKKYGKGVVQVEKDFKDRDSAHVKTETTKLNIRDQPSTSKQSQDAEFYEKYMCNSLPDPTKSDYYCKLCDSHSNCESMWSFHIMGKRHLANLKKNPGLAPSKTKYIRAERNVKPILFKIIEEENEYNSPIVGLNQIRETRKPYKKGVLFNCFLCGSCMSTMDIMTHILSPKHREKYLISIKHPEMEMLKSLPVSESNKRSILEDICRRVQDIEGMGTPDVFYTKNAEFYEKYMCNSLPDPTKSDYYCKLCDSHCNCESMWSFHIMGKRHLANLKKNPGLAPSKTKYIRAERNVKPILFKIIEEENEYNSPIVG